MTGMRAALAVAGALLAFGLTGSGCGTLPQRAWCANTTELTGNDCSYDTFQQCRNSIAGLSGGTCSENPRYRATRSRVR